MEPLAITYRFILRNKQEKKFVVLLHPETLDPLNPLPAPLPEWTELTFHQCENCPLDPKTHPHCPLAVRIAKVIDLFRDLVSHQEVEVRVETPERTVSKHTTAQQGASALMGLVMAISGCPHTAFFKPMAAHHLPMATLNETIYRAASMYALAQYYVQQDGDEPDLGMKGLQAIYRELEVLNKHMARRVRAAIAQDAALNAIVILDFFAKNFTVMIDEKLEEFKHLFELYRKRK